MSDIRPLQTSFAPKQFVRIESEADFPAPVSGVITLENNITYLISAKTVLIANRLEIPSGADVAFTNGGPLNALVYTGIGAMISGTNINSLDIYQTNLVTAHPSGSMFDITGTTSAASFILLSVVFLDTANLGLIHDITTFFITVTNQNFTQGLEFQDNANVVIINFNVFSTPNTPGCVFFTFKGNIPIITFGNVVTFIGTNETLFDLDAALVSSSGYFIAINAIGPGLVFKSGSLDQTHIPFKFVACKNIAESIVKSQANLENNALVTDIPAQNSWVIANGGTAFTFTDEERIVGLTDGGMKYIGLEDFSPVLDGNINLDPATATKNLESRFLVIKNTLFEVTFTSGTNTINEVGHALSNGDVISFKNTAGTLPAELRADIAYYVVNAATDTFQVSYTLGGAAVAFTDDGTPTNSYSMANLNGGVGRATISGGNPVDVVPQSLVFLKTNYQVYVVVRNTSDAVNIEVHNAYYRLRK